MKNGNIARTWLAAAAALFVVGTASYASAQEAPVAKIIVVDLREVQKSSLAGKDFARQVETLRADLETDKQKLEKQAADAEQELSRQKAILSDAAFEEKRKAAAQQFADSRNSLQDKANRVQVALGNADRDLQSALNPIYTAVLSKYAANMILDRSVIVATGQVTDVTREVIQQLDQKMPSIKLNMPAAGSTPKQ
ncbi:OmpH family outer membrane protein [Emcibacter sp. SYSU 3D8]|uniref:OmpH family outer membrane protein n=1 Tax=Emcibacter sp. SYSU 3D8 TaxID=3133969 RepID=UPI0031FED9C2